MIRTRITSTGKRALGTAVGAATLCFAGVFAAGTPSAFAESATSPTGIVTMSVPAPVVAGLPSTYTLTFANTTTSPMSGIVAQSTLPSGMTVKNINNCANLARNHSSGWMCELPNLAAGASDTATFSILADTVGTYDIPVTVSGDIAVAPGTFQVLGDSLDLTVTVQPGPTDLQVTGSSNNGSPPVGSTFNYTFQVKDNGPLPASGVTLSDAVPSAIRLTGASSVDIGSCTVDTTSNSVHCNIGALAVGQQSTISLSASPTTAGTFPNTAVVAMSGTDTQPPNNSVTVTVQPK